MRGRNNNINSTLAPPTVSDSNTCTNLSENIRSAENARDERPAGIPGIFIHSLSFSMIVDNHFLLSYILLSYLFGYIPQHPLRGKFYMKYNIRYVYCIFRVKFSSKRTFWNLTLITFILIFLSFLIPRRKYALDDLCKNLQ